MKKTLFIAALLCVGLCSCNDSIKGDNGKLKNNCGNGVRDYGEICDGNTDASCYTFDATKDWQEGGIPGCSDTCQLTQGTCAEKTVVTTCGNGGLDPNEPCDGTLFANPSQTCASYLGAGATGRLVCDNCRVSTENCIPSTSCGNGQLEPNELCDGTIFGGETCANYAGEGATGSLRCIGCKTLDITGCIPSAGNCGNNQIDDGEVCDGDDIGNVTCNDLITGGNYTGTPHCNETCSGFYLTGCVPDPGKGCGNYRIDEGELCDNTDVGEATCESVMGAGYTGALICANDCQSYITSECVPPSVVTCGNGQIDEGEDCESPTILNGATCASVLGSGYIGNLSCTRGCKFDTSDCIPVTIQTCLNGVREGDEECDDLDMPVSTCEQLLGTGYAGELSCTSECTFDTSSCRKTECGNGEIDPGEECDSNNLNGVTCAMLDGPNPDGELRCDSNCRFDVSGCYEPSHCGNDALDEGEVCDSSIPLFSPLTCTYAPNAVSDFVREFYYIRPSDANYGEVEKYVRNPNVPSLIIPWSTSCSASCEFSPRCEESRDSWATTTLFTDTLISKLTTGGNVDEKKLKNAGFSWNLNSALSVDTDYTYAFGAWKAGENGLPNLQWYVAYDLTKANASIATDYNNTESFIAVSFYAVKKQANSIDTLTVMLYDGDTPVGKIADVSVGAHGNHWQNSGELVFSIQGLTQPAIRFVSAKSGSAIKLKNLHVTGVHLIIKND